MPLYIQEKVHPKVLIDDLLRQSTESKHAAGQLTADLFADFNGMPKGADKTEFYQHDQNWSNRMILAAKGLAQKNTTVFACQISNVAVSKHQSGKETKNCLTAHEFIAKTTSRAKA